MDNTGTMLITMMRLRNDAWYETSRTLGIGAFHTTWANENGDRVVALVIPESGSQQGLNAWAKAEHEVRYWDLDDGGQDRETYRRRYVRQMEVERQVQKEAHDEVLREYDFAPQGRRVG